VHREEREEGGEERGKREGAGRKGGEGQRSKYREGVNGKREAR